MKNLFQDAFSQSLDKEGAGVMHLKKQEAEKSGKKEFKLGSKTFPVKEKKKILDKEGAGTMHFKKDKAIEKGEDTFKVGDKVFPVKEKHEKWIQDVKVKKGGLHKSLHVPQGQKIPASKLNKALHSKNPHIQHQAQFAKNAKGLKENTMNLDMEARPRVPAAAPVTNNTDDGEAAWNKTLDKHTDPKRFDAAHNPALKLDTEGVEKAREWIRKLDDMATFINGTEDSSLNAQINALEMRNSIPFKGIVRREEKRITKLAENLRGLAELFKTVVTSSGKKIHDATSKITTR